jgi:hypothetical protein
MLNESERYRVTTHGLIRVVQIREGSPNPLANKDPHWSIFASGFGPGGPFWGEGQICWDTGVANLPNFLRNLLIFEHENFRPKFVSINCWSLGDVNSSLLSICASIKSKTSIGTLSFRRGAAVDSVWFCLNRYRNFHNPTLEISNPSLSKIRNICDGL